MSDDDTAWLNALAGRSGGEHSRGITQEALALRELIRVQESAGAQESGNTLEAIAEVDIARENELIARAAAEGLLPGRRAPMRAAWRRRISAQRLGFAAAAVLILAVGVGLLRSMQPPAETFRGAENGTVRLEARNPPALKRQLIDELSKAGVAASGYERLGTQGIDADLPQPVPAPIRAILERHHIPVPSDGALIVEIEPPSKP